MNLDFAQTFEIAGADQPEDMQGASMKPVFEGIPKDWRKVFTTTITNSQEPIVLLNTMGFVRNVIN